MGRIPASETLASAGPLGAAERMVAALREPRCYPHPVTRVEVVETHISWVLLTGSQAYKLRKPVRLPFLDFTSAAARRRDCEAELHLNRRLAPELYLGLVAIRGTPEAPRVCVEDDGEDGKEDGPLLDWAVRMVQFPPGARLDRALARGRIGAAEIERLAAELAAFHARAGIAGSDSPHGSAEAVEEQCLANFRALEQVRLGAADRARLAALRDWTRASLAEHGERFGQRRRAGWVRECHGDLHLGNIVLLDGRPVPFDCLEFDPALRWIDTLSEVAFLFMDLEAHGRSDLAWGFLDAYLERSGDYEGLALLRHYLVYRALVRAKVFAIQLRQGAPSRTLRARLRAQIALAERYATAPPGGILIITHGLSGAGKSWLSARLLEPLGAVRVRSDVERRRLDTGKARYTESAARRTYERLEDTARAVLAAGYPVILDATFLDQGGRERLRALAGERQVPFRILSVHAPLSLLEARVVHRASTENDPSEATPEVIELQREKAEPLTAVERAAALVIDTSREVDIDALVERLRHAPGAHLRSVHEPEAGR